MSDSPAPRQPGNEQDDQLRRVAADLRAAYASKQDAEAQLRHAELWSVRVLVRAVRVRCRRLAEHLRRTGHYAAELSRALGLDGEEIERIGAGACLHDIGLLETPDYTAAGMSDLYRACQTLREHPERGHAIVRGSDLELFHCVEQVAIGHHERWDGSGFPRGLSRTEIPFAARVVAVADAYDALREPGRLPAPLSHAGATSRLLEGGDGIEPGWFDPEVLGAFARIGARLDRMTDLMGDGRL